MPLFSLCVLFRRATLAACAALLVACAAAPRDAGSAKLALVIGNAAYDNAPALVNPVNDAADMCAALTRLGFKTLCHTNVRDRAEFDAVVKNYVDRLGPQSVGVFYYSGHGVQAGNANYLIPTQVQPAVATEDPRRVLYGVEDLYVQLRTKPVKFQLVVLDACRTDLFAQAPRQPAGRGPNTVARSSLIRALEIAGAGGNGLGPINDAPPATMVFYATAAKDAAFDGEGRNGPLTKHILLHIGTRGQLVEDFIKSVTVGVETETLRDYRKRQTPFIYGSFSGKFCFAGCPGEGWVPPLN